MRKNEEKKTEQLTSDAGCQKWAKKRRTTKDDYKCLLQKGRKKERSGWKGGSKEETRSFKGWVGGGNYLWNVSWTIRRGGKRKIKSERILGLGMSRWRRAIRILSNYNNLILVGKEGYWRRKRKGAPVEEPR